RPWPRAGCSRWRGRSSRARWPKPRWRTSGSSPSSRTRWRRRTRLEGIAKEKAEVERQLAEAARPRGLPEERAKRAERVEKIMKTGEAERARLESLVTASAEEKEAVQKQQAALDAKIAEVTKHNRQLQAQLQHREKVEEAVKLLEEEKGKIQEKFEASQAEQRRLEAVLAETSQRNQEPPGGSATGGRQEHAELEQQSGELRRERGELQEGLRQQGLDFQERIRTIEAEARLVQEKAEQQMAEAVRERDDAARALQQERAERQREVQQAQEERKQDTPPGRRAPQPGRATDGRLLAGSTARRRFVGIGVSKVAGCALRRVGSPPPPAASRQGGLPGADAGRARVPPTGGCGDDGATQGKQQEGRGAGAATPAPRGRAPRGAAAVGDGTDGSCSEASVEDEGADDLPSRGPQWHLWRLGERRLGPEAVFCGDGSSGWRRGRGGAGVADGPCADKRTEECKQLYARLDSQILDRPWGSGAAGPAESPDGEARVAPSDTLLAIAATGTLAVVFHPAAAASNDASPPLEVRAGPPLAQHEVHVAIGSRCVRVRVAFGLDPAAPLAAGAPPRAPLEAAASLQAGSAARRGDGRDLQGRAAGAPGEAAAGRPGQRRLQEALEAGDPGVSEVAKAWQASQSGLPGGQLCRDPGLQQALEILGVLLLELPCGTAPPGGQEPADGRRSVQWQVQGIGTCQVHAWAPELVYDLTDGEVALWPAVLELRPGRGWLLHAGAAAASLLAGLALLGWGWHGGEAATAPAAPQKAAVAQGARGTPLGPDAAGGASGPQDDRPAALTGTRRQADVDRALLAESVRMRRRLMQDQRRWTSSVMVVSVLAFISLLFLTLARCGKRAIDLGVQSALGGPNRELLGRASAAALRGDLGSRAAFREACRGGRAAAIRAAIRFCVRADRVRKAALRHANFTMGNLTEAAQADDWVRVRNITLMEARRPASCICRAIAQNPWASVGLLVAAAPLLRPAAEGGAAADRAAHDRELAAPPRRPPAAAAESAGPRAPQQEGALRAAAGSAALRAPTRVGSLGSSLGGEEQERHLSVARELEQAQERRQAVARELEQALAEGRAKDTEVVKLKERLVVVERERELLEKERMVVVDGAKDLDGAASGGAAAAAAAVAVQASASLGGQLADSERARQAAAEESGRLAEQLQQAMRQNEESCSGSSTRPWRRSRSRRPRPRSPRTDFSRILDGWLSTLEDAQGADDLAQCAGQKNKDGTRSAAGPFAARSSVCLEAGPIRAPARVSADGGRSIPSEILWPIQDVSAGSPRFMVYVYAMICSSTSPPRLS
ncbi:unnamed protein product, partial [Prorocentrum cordatum]